MANTFTQIYIHAVFAVQDRISLISPDRKEEVHKYFSWQEGFGAFSYSHSQLATVNGYIQNQERHHARRTFQEEYVTMLKRFDVAYDQKYLFHLIE